MKPLFHIRDDFNPVRLFEIKNNGEEPSRLIELNMDEITSSSTLRKRLFGIGDYIWMARDEQLIKLLGYLGRVTETADPIKQLGWQREGFYAFCNGASEDGTWIPIDDMGILRLQAGKYYLPAMSKLNKDSRELYVSEKSFGMRRWLTTRQVSQTFLPRSCKFSATTPRWGCASMSPHYSGTSSSARVVPFRSSMPLARRDAVRLNSLQR